MGSSGTHWECPWGSAGARISALGAAQGSVPSLLVSLSPPRGPPRMFCVAAGPVPGVEPKLVPYRAPHSLGIPGRFLPKVNVRNPFPQWYREDPWICVSLGFWLS